MYEFLFEWNVKSSHIFMCGIYYEMLARAALAWHSHMLLWFASVVAYTYMSLSEQSSVKPRRGWKIRNIKHGQVFMTSAYALCQHPHFSAWNDGVLLYWLMNIFIAKYLFKIGHWLTSREIYNRNKSFQPRFTMISIKSRRSLMLAIEEVEYLSAILASRMKLWAPLFSAVMRITG